MVDECRTQSCFLRSVLGTLTDIPLLVDVKETNMRLLPRRTRDNVLLAAIFLTVILCYFTAFTLFDRGDEMIRSHDDMDIRASRNGGKMKIFPAAKHNFQQSLEVDIDHQLEDMKEEFHGRRDGHQQKESREVLPDRAVIYYDDEDEDANSEKDNVDIKRERAVKKKETFVGDFNRIINENKALLFDGHEINRQGQIPGPPDQFLSYNRRQVQHCITHRILGHIPPNIKSEEFKIPELATFQSESAKSRKDSFGNVFAKRAWGQGWDKAYDRLDASGRGATLSWAQEVIATLHILINDLKTSLGKPRIRILDLPCGDMAWMSRFLVMRDDVDYTGVDIVPELIANHRNAYKSYPWRFRLVDILEHPLEEKFDLIVNRMMLQHLFYSDAFRLLKQFSDSKSTVLLTSTFLRTETNTELNIANNLGRVRKLNLGIPPLSLAPPVCVVRDGPPDTFEGWDHFIGVWELPLRQVVPECRHANEITLKGTDKKVYDCIDWSGR